MEKYIHVMTQSIELSMTIIEGVEHIQNLINEERVDTSTLLFEDVVAAFFSIERSVGPIENELKSNSVGQTVKQMKPILEQIVTGFEDGNMDTVQEVIQFSLLPACKKLTTELENSFQPYVTS